MNHRKAVKPGPEKSFERYDLSRDIEEQRNLADQFPHIFNTMTRFAEEAHIPPRSGLVLDTSVGFQGHDQE